MANLQSNLGAYDVKRFEEDTVAGARGRERHGTAHGTRHTHGSERGASTGCWGVGGCFAAKHQEQALDGERRALGACTSVSPRFRSLGSDSRVDGSYQDPSKGCPMEAPAHYLGISRQDTPFSGPGTCSYQVSFS